MKLMQRSNVLLPDPLEPTIAMRSPRCTSSVTPRSTCSSPKRLCRSRTRIRVSAIAPGLGDSIAGGEPALEPRRQIAARVEQREVSEPDHAQDRQGTVEDEVEEQRRDR